MEYQNIDKNSVKYKLLETYARLPFKHFYSKIEIAHADRIPKNQPVIIPANHQNALMDALAIIFNTPSQPVFLARSDIFSSRLLIWFLTTIKIMPIYRIRDGAEKLKKNEEIFERTVQVLKNKNNPLCIMPEGNHGDKRRLRPLVKGIFRIAFRAQEDMGKKESVKIIPVGIDYGHYQKARQYLFLNVGNAIDVSDYLEKYQENQATTINEIRAKLSEELKKLMIHIESEDYYDTYMQLRTIYNKTMCAKMGVSTKSLLNRFNADKKMIAQLDERATEEELKELKALNTTYSDQLEKENVRDWIISKTHHSIFEILGKSVLALIGFPLYLLGLITGYLPYKIPTLFVKKIKDAQFHSSVKYVIALLLFTLYLLILSILALVFIRPVWLAIVLIALFIPISKFALEYYIYTKKLFSLIRYYFNKKKFKGLREIRKKIMDIMDKITSRPLSPESDNLPL